MATAVEERTDAKKGWSTDCRAGNHTTCKTVKARCVCSCHGPNGQQPPKPGETTPAHVCPECNEEFETPQGLGAHRFRAHGVRSQNVSGEAKPKTPKRPVLIELVDEEPPPPPEPERKPIERIIGMVEAADLTAGKWQRCALFHSPRSAKSMATRLREQAPGYEWETSNDGRLFVRIPEGA